MQSNAKKYNKSNTIKHACILTQGYSLHFPILPQSHITICEMFKHLTITKHLTISKHLTQMWEVLTFQIFTKLPENCYKFSFDLHFSYSYYFSYYKFTFSFKLSPYNHKRYKRHKRHKCHKRHTKQPFLNPIFKIFVPIKIKC